MTTNNESRVETIDEGPDERIARLFQIQREIIKGTYDVPVTDAKVVDGILRDLGEPPSTPTTDKSAWGSKA